MKSTLLATSFRMGLLTLCASAISLVCIPYGSTTIALAQDAELNRLIREADKATGTRSIRSKRSKGTWTTLSGPNFSGNWGGTYSLARSNCQTNVRSFNFRHSLLQSGGRASLNTSHDGGFYGTSRDRGRRLEFAKSVRLSDGRTCGVAVVYKDITRDRRSTNTAYAASCSGCTWAYAARARR